MQRVLSALTRYSPVIMLASLALTVVILLPKLEPALSGLDGVLARFPTFYLTVAAASWLAVAGGIAFETLVKPGSPRRKGLLMDVLNRLTNRAALERMLANQDQGAIVIDAVDLASRLKARVIGQDAVCDDLAAQIRRRLALNTRGKPVGIFLLAGPPGTGKTYLSGQLAKELARPLLQFDMTQFSSPHAATQLFGSPKGYVGSDTYGKLTNALRETPDAVVLLDEIEKAHPDVHKKFLTAWNDGYLTEASDGKQISTTRSIFMLTSNAATDALIDIASRLRQDPDEMRRASVDALRKAGFAPEVLNRLDRIFVFARLEGLDVARVAALEIESMIRNYGLDVADGGIDPMVLFTLMQRQERLGASASVRDLVRSIEEAISDSLISARQARARKVSLVEHDGIVQAEVAD